MDNIEIFKYLTTAQRDRILAQANEVEYDAGAEIFAANTLGNEMFLIKTGRVKIYKVFEGNEITFAELGPGDVFGEMSLLDDYPRSAAAAALMPAALYSLSRTAFRTFLEREPEIAT